MTAPKEMLKTKGVCPWCKEQTTFTWYQEEKKNWPQKIVLVFDEEKCDACGKTVSNNKNVVPL